ncbi:MAG TPA: hypothetical protein VMS71_08300 [Candidatus Acidoferrum sp.]|nr:hypothetical protein [Candidatus Acidoferrum sp.]
MISMQLFVYCLVIAAAYLLVISFVLDRIEKKLGLTAGLPPELLETTGITWTIMNFFMEAVFFVVLPTIVYSFFYSILPFAGVRAGLAGALFALVIGAAPIVMRLSVRVKLPMPFLLFLLVSFLIKLAGTLAIIGYLYSL